VREVMPISLTRRFVYLLVLVAILLVGAVTVPLVTSSNRSHASAVAHRLSEANMEGQTLGSALINQETGVRGYL
jgi:CHASE3 domain sensor protein